MSVLEEELIDVGRGTDRPKMWHLMDEIREDGNWTLCGLYLDPNETNRKHVPPEEQTDCIVCEDLWQWRERMGLV